MKSNFEDKKCEVNITLLFGISEETACIVDKLPHIVTKTSSGFLERLSVITKSKPCPWLAFPWYDDNGKYVDPDEIEEKICFERWSNKFNQEELLKSCGAGGLYNFSSNNWLIVDSMIGLTKLKEIFGEHLNECTAQEVEDMAIKALTNIDLLGWFILIDNADADYLLFISSKKHRKWIAELKTM